MPFIIVGSRARLTNLFTKDDVPYDPETILFSMWFTPSVAGQLVQQTSYQYGVDAQVVRKSTGLYYVEVLFQQTGTVKNTWRSTAFGEEVNVEFSVDVKPRTVLEKAG